MLEGPQHLTHSTLLNAFYLKKLIRQQRCYLLVKERRPLGHTHTILGLQPRDKAAMLGVKTKEYFLEEFT